MSARQETPAGCNMGHRHSLTIETNPLHLLPSNIRRFSVADQMRPPIAPLFAKLNNNKPHIQEAKEIAKELAEKEESGK